MWEIIDDDGVIYSGDEWEMRAKFQDMIGANGDDLREDWTGDLKLVQVLEIYR